MPRQTYPPASFNALSDIWQGVKVERATATLPQSTHAPIFNITGGRVVVTAIIGQVTTTLGAVGNVKLTSYNTAGSVSSDLCAVVAAGTTAAYAQLSIDGVPGDAKRSCDVRALIQEKVDGGRTTFLVKDLTERVNPAYRVVKTLSVEYSIGEERFQTVGKDTDMISLRHPKPAPERLAEMICDPSGGLHLSAQQPGSYEWITASGRTNRAEITSVPPLLEISEPWQLSFPPKWGAPEVVTLTNLISWADHADEGVKHFSGTATYRTTFEFPDSKLNTKNSKLFLALGDVQVMARVKLNGRDCGIAWKPPFRVEITEALRSGANALEIQVANLWLNRMIGDAALSTEQRFTWSSWEPFKTDTPLLKSGLLGPVRIEVEN